jgi:hypothetical protein
LSATRQTPFAKGCGKSTSVAGIRIRIIRASRGIPPILRIFSTLPIFPVLRKPFHDVCATEPEAHRGAHNRKRMGISCCRTSARQVVDAVGFAAKKYGHFLYGQEFIWGRSRRCSRSASVGTSVGPVGTGLGGLFDGLDRPRERTKTLLDRDTEVGVISGSVSSLPAGGVLPGRLAARFSVFKLVVGPSYRTTTVPPAAGLYSPGR